MKKFILGTIVGIILCGGIVYGASIYESNSIEYSPTDASWEVNNVDDAINSLYSMKQELETIKTIGNATASDILKGKTAVVKGNTITGTGVAGGNYDVKVKVYLNATNDSSEGYKTATKTYTIAIRNGKVTAGDLGMIRADYGSSSWTSALVYTSIVSITAVS